MKVHWSIVAVTCLVLTSSVPAADKGAAAGDGVIQDTHNFRELFAELLKVVPSGWKVVESFDKITPSLSRQPRPTLIIKSEQALPFEHIEIGAPVRVADEPEKPPVLETVEIRLVAMPYLSPDERAAAAQRNNQRLAQRLDFERKRLKDLSYAWKGPSPAPPRAYTPQTSRQQSIVREYAFLWLHTEPVPLPSHHYRTLAFEMESNPWGTIRDEQKMNQYRTLLSSLQQIAVPYEKPATGEFVGE